MFVAGRALCWRPSDVGAHSGRVPIHYLIGDPIRSVPANALCRVHKWRPAGPGSAPTVLQVFEVQDFWKQQTPQRLLLVDTRLFVGTTQGGIHEYRIDANGVPCTGVPGATAHGNPAVRVTQLQLFPRGIRGSVAPRLAASIAHPCDLRKFHHPRGVLIKKKSKKKKPVPAMLQCCNVDGMHHVHLAQVVTLDHMFGGGAERVTSNNRIGVPGPDRVLWGEALAATNYAMPSQYGTVFALASTSHLGAGAFSKRGDWYWLLSGLRNGGILVH